MYQLKLGRLLARGLLKAQRIRFKIAALMIFASLPSNGLFTANHTSATDLVFDVALQATSVILVAPNATRWRVTVDNSGTLSTAQVT